MSGSRPWRSDLPAPRIFLVRLVKAVIAAGCRPQSGFEIGRPAEPAIGYPRPFGDRIAPGSEVSGRTRCDEIAMGEAAPFGRTGQNPRFLVPVAMQRIVQPGNQE